MRLIDADALLEQVNAWIFNVHDNRHVEDVIKDAPTVQREGWVSVDELPDDYNKKVGDGYKKYWVIDSIGNQWSAELYYIAEGASTQITHWQPLPAAPKE